MKIHEKFIAAEIEIEFKAALYFYTMSFFYFAYRIWLGSFEADIPVLIEMILSTYLMGYVQFFCLGNFDEAERLEWKVALKVLGCTLVYVGLSWIFKWFDRNLVVTGIYFTFMLVCYGCVFWFYSVRRDVSTKAMNEELAAFKKKKEGML